MAIFCFSNENTQASKNIVKKSMTIFNDFFEEIKNSRNSYQMRIKRSSCSQMFFKIGVIGVLGLKVYKKEPPTQVFCCEIYEMSNFLENLFLQNTSGDCF